MTALGSPVRATRSRFTRVTVATATSLATGVALLAAAPAGSASVASASATSPEADAVVAGTLRRHADGVATARVDLSGTGWSAAARRSSARPAGTVTVDNDVTMAAATWTGPGTPDLLVRGRSAGRWGRWVPLTPTGDAPDGAESRARRGTDLVWLGASDRVQVTARGEQPADLELWLSDSRGVPVTPAGTAAAAGTPTPARATSAQQAKRAKRAKRAKGPVRPHLRSRKSWGAKGKLRNGEPVYQRTIRQVHVHHTASGNDYRKRDVPGLIRSMYRYHTRALGWFDLGYNFLVDRFGRSWVGRSGGPAKFVVGAHTLGFNHKSTGIAVIGNFEGSTPPRAVLGAVSRIAAWKLHRAGRDRATGTLRITSKGSDRYASGRRVRLPVVTGHRDTNQTACPGEHLYDRLPKIRARIQRRLDRA